MNWPLLSTIRLPLSLRKRSSYLVIYLLVTPQAIKTIILLIHLEHKNITLSIQRNFFQKAHKIWIIFCNLYYLLFLNLPTIKHQNDHLPKIKPTKYMNWYVIKNILLLGDVVWDEIVERFVFNWLNEVKRRLVINILLFRDVVWDEIEERFVFNWAKEVKRRLW